MSEENGYATKEALETRRGKRRFKFFEWSDIGKVQLRSAMAGEWVKIDSARQRASMASMAGRKKEHEAATQDFLLQVCLQLVLDKDGNPFFTPNDKDLILSLDSADVDPLVSAAIEHCSAADADAGTAQKNLQPTNSGETPSGSGST